MAAQYAIEAAKDANLAASMGNEQSGDETQSESSYTAPPATSEVAARKESKYCPGAWGNRFEALAHPSTTGPSVPPQKLRRTPQNPQESEATPAEAIYDKHKAEVDTLRRQREEAEDRKEAHRREAERQQIVGQQARERVRQTTDDLASAKRDVRQSEEAPAAAETGVRDARQATSSTQRDVEASRGKREVSRLEHIKQDQTGLPTAGPPLYNPAPPTLRVTPAGGGVAGGRKGRPGRPLTRPSSRPSSP